MEIKVSYEIAASAADIWSVIGERFDDMSWSDDVIESHLEGELGVGGVRVCRFPPNMFARNGESKERLIAFDRKTMTFAYEAMGMSGVMKEATNRWKVVPLGPERCRVDMRATVELGRVATVLAHAMRPLLHNMGRRTLRELERRVVGAPALVRSPWWFWSIAATGLLIYLAGVGLYLVETGLALSNPSALVDMFGETNAALVLTRPSWVVIAYAVGLFGGAAGCGLLLLRRRAAVWPLEGSLIAVLVLQFYWWSVIDVRDWIWPVGIATASAALMALAMRRARPHHRLTPNP